MAGTEQLMLGVKGLLDAWVERDPETSAGAYYQDLRTLFETHGGTVEEDPMDEDMGEPMDETMEEPMEEEGLPGEEAGAALEEAPPNAHGYAPPPSGPGGPEGGMRGARILAVQFALDKEKGKDKKEPEENEESK